MSAAKFTLTEKIKCSIDRMLEANARETEKVISNFMYETYLPLAQMLNQAQIDNFD
jgi:hypothetical protein